MDSYFDKLCKLFEAAVQRTCPCIYLAIFGDEIKYKRLKKGCSFMYGMLLGFLFYEMILVDLDFTPFSAIAMALGMSLMLGTSITLSKQVRCIALLSIPSFAGKSGRGVLKAVVMAFIIAGPIANMAENGKDVARVFSCTASLTFNLTKSRFELMFKPFQQGLFGMKSDVNDIKDTVRSIKDVTSPIAGELEGEAEMAKMKEENDYLDDLQKDSKRSEEIDKKYDTVGEQAESERYRKKYLKKIETRCEDQLTKAGRKCRDMFAKAYDKCYDKVTWLAAWLLCWPMKLTFVCNIIESVGGSKTCDPAKDMDPGFGEGYTYLKNSRTELTQNFKDVKLQYKIGKIKQIQDIREATDSAKAILHEVKKKKTFLDSLMSILKRILAFVFLKIILDAQKYHDFYLRDIEYDNIYITQYFRKIDARRKAQEKHTLLPLKKIERLKMVDPRSLTPLKTEREEILGQTVLLLLEVIAATVLILIDRLFYEILDIIRRHARIDYTQVGHHDLLLDVRGVGLIASVLRKIVGGFNIKKRIKVVRSNAECLPRPTIMPTHYFLKIYGTYFAVWLLILSQAYIQRCRRVICSFFYRKREKRRVLFLYNEALKRRVGFFRYMKKKIKKMVREESLEEDLSFFNVLRIRFPIAFVWLKIFPMARRKCIICRDPEPLFAKNVAGNFTNCPNPTCYVVYCLECWFDIGETCYACAVDADSETEYDDSDSGLGDDEN